MAWPIAGVIEGFYGRPWSWDERVELMRFCHERGMSHYVYAPKDDPKHREQWGEPYTPDELDGFRRLVAEGGLGVGFAISPGLSIDYRSPADRSALMAKLEQALSAGITLLCLALDDIPLRDGLGEDQASLTAWLRERIGDTRLILVPTEYVGTARSPYLDALAAGVPDDVAIAWTGMSVVNDTITAAEARARAGALGGRPPLVWDNFPVNDGVMADRLFMGPLRGRDPALADECGGYLANPMVQPMCSKLPLASVAAWLTGDDPVVAWEAQAGAARAFAEACDGTTPRALVGALVDEGDGPGWPGAAGRLAAWLREAAECDAPGVEEEASPWIEQVRAEAEVGLLALALYQLTRPVVRVDAGGRGRAAPPDAERAVRLSFALAVRWGAVRRSPVSVMGVRWGFRPALGQGAAGGWRVLPDALQEDENAIDALARLALGEAAHPNTASPLWVAADGEEVALAPDGSFTAAPTAVVIARAGGAVTRVTGPCDPPVQDRRL